MTQIVFNLKNVVCAVFINLIISGVSFVVHSHVALSSELTFDFTSYSYREVDQNDNFFMEDKSSPFLSSIGIRNWGDNKAISKTQGFDWMSLYTLEYSFGNIDYTSAGTGTMKKEYYKSRLEYYISTTSRFGANDLKPYIGLGYRDLLDDSGFKRSSTNHIGYDRLSQYYYIPIGAIWYINERLSLKSQYNYFLKGKQTSFLNEVLPNTYPANIENIQRLGWGIDITLRSKLNDRWYTYGFFRTWNIEDSDLTSCSPLIYCYEPKNQTREIGAGISYNF
jgi:hypothetical protein